MTASRFSLPPQAHITPYRVVYADIDRMGRMYYANYLVCFERGRTELLRAAGFPYRALEEQQGLFLPVRRCEIRYLGYAVYDDDLRIATWVTRLRHATVSFANAICRAQESRPLVWGEVELAAVDASGRPQPLPPHVAEALEKYAVASKALP